jgi:AraC-like DNA-binding protein
MAIFRFTHKEGVFQVNARPFAALSFRKNGTGSFEIGGKSFTTRQGDVLFIPADTPYRVEYSVSDIIVVHLENCNYFEPENITLQNPAAIAHRFEHLLEAWSERHSVNQAKSAIYDILERIATDKETSIDHTAFANCLRYVNANFCDPALNIETICQRGFMSASSLQRAFREHLGLSPKQYLDKQRMNKAFELLADGGTSVKETAYACGFTDEKYFSRAFKKKYGYPPSQLQNNEGV